MGSKMNRTVLLFMLILSMVSLPTSLPKHLLVETADKGGDDYSRPSPRPPRPPPFFLLATIAWDNRMKDRITDVSRPHDPIHLVPVHHLVQIPGQGAGDGAAPVTSWVDNWTLMV